MSTTVTKSRSDYTAAEIDVALTHLAMRAGNAAAASRDLADNGMRIPPRTIRAWASIRHVERYEQIRTDIHTRLHHKMAAMSEDLVVKAVGTQHKVLDRLDREVHKLGTADLAKTFQHLAVSSGIHNDKSRLLRDEATTIVDDRTSAEVMRKLQALGVARPMRIDAEAKVETLASVPDRAAQTREQTSS